MIIVANYTHLAPETNLGDAILAIPLIRHYAALAAHENVYIVGKCPGVHHYFLGPRFQPIENLPYDSGQRVVRISINDLIYSSIGRSMHPTAGLFLLHGQPVPGGAEVVQPQLVYDDVDTPTYDYVFAPWCVDANRAWNIEGWSNVLISLMAQCRYRGENPKIAVIGGGDEARPWAGVEYVYGMYLVYVMSLIKRAKCIITVDTGPSRFAHAVDHPNHVLLASDVTPLAWQTHPKARALYGRSLWTVENVTNMIVGRPIT